MDSNNPIKSVNSIGTAGQTKPVVRVNASNVAPTLVATDTKCAAVGHASFRPTAHQIEIAAEFGVLPSNVTLDHVFATALARGANAAEPPIPASKADVSQTNSVARVAVKTVSA